MIKNSTWTLLALVLGLLTSWRVAAAAPAPRVVAVVNRAAWCSVCKTHGPRVAKLLMKDAAAGALTLVVNDVTDAKTTAASAVGLKAAGVDQAVSPTAATGVILLFDATTKRPLRQVTVANTDGEIEMVIGLAIKEASAP